MKHNLNHDNVRGAGIQLILVFTLLGCQWATAQTNFFPILRCKDHTYTNATINMITPATVNVSWGSSGAIMSITNLPDKLQTRYHYDQRKAEKYLALQANEKAAQKDHDTQEAAAFAAVQNTLGPAQNIRIVKTLLFPGSLQIEAEGVLSEASIPNLPPEILTFITKLDQAQADAASLKQSAQQVRSDADRADGIAEGIGIYDSNYEEQIIQANVQRNDARSAEHKSADAAAELQKLQAQAKDRTTIIARPTGKMITARLRQWQFQEMAAVSPIQ
jgi:hypothetical protein